MKTPRYWTGLLSGLLSVFVAGAFGACEGGGDTDDSETHFLVTCDGACPGSLQCVCGVCTKTCSEVAACPALQGATCDNSCGRSDEPVCDVTCVTSDDCHSLGETFACSAGHCRQRLSPDIDSGGHGETGTGEPPTCLTGPGVTTLYEGNVTSFVTTSDRVVILGDSLLSVPLAGGAPIVLATPSLPHRLFAIGAMAYYEEWNPPSGGGMPLMAVPVQGGEAEVFLPALSAVGIGTGGTDGTSYYFTPLRHSGDFGGLSSVTPPSTSVDALTTEPFIASSIVTEGAYVYFIGTDVDETLGFIGRVPKSGGAMEQIVPDIGIPVITLAVDEKGVYWNQPLSRWADGVHAGAPYVVMHANLDGSSAERLTDDAPSSLAALRGRLYFTTASGVNSIAATGGAVTTIATNQRTPSMLTISGGNLVWLDAPDEGEDAGVTSIGGSPSASGRTRVVTTCIP
jgi:hypothetical protein